MFAVKPHTSVSYTKQSSCECICHKERPWYGQGGFSYGTEPGARFCSKCCNVKCIQSTELEFGQGGFSYSVIKPAHNVSQDKK